MKRLRTERSILKGLIKHTKGKKPTTQTKRKHKKKSSRKMSKLGKRIESNESLHGVSSALKKPKLKRERRLSSVCMLHH